MVTKDTELSGVTLPKGEPAEVLAASANRDENKWVEPERFDVKRAPFPNLALEKGIQFYIGPALAGMERTVACSVVSEEFEIFFKIHTKTRKQTESW